MRIYKTRKDFTALNAAGNPGVFAGTVCTITDESTNPMYVFQNNTWNSTVTAIPDPLTGGNVFSAAGQLFGAKAGLNHKNIGTRILFGRMGTVNNGTPKTYHVTAEAACHFDAIRPIFASNDAARSYQMTVVKASVLSDISTDAAMLNNSGTWASVTYQGLTAFPIKTAQGGGSSYRIAYTTPDWLPLSSIPRTDGGTLPLVAFRCYPNDSSATALPVYGNNGTDNLSTWATRSSRKWFARQLDGDGVSTPTNFTGGSSAAPQSVSPIIGFQYLARGTVVTVCAVGDSIADGRGTYKGEGFGLLVSEAMQAAYPQIAVEYMDCGFSGQTNWSASNGISGYGARALDILNTPDIVPDVMIYQAGSPNDETTTLTAGGITNQLQAVYSVVQEAKRRGVALVINNWIPTNYAVYPRGSTDSLRVAFNATIAAKYSNVVDLSTLFTGSLDGNSQWTLNPAYATDGIHPNDAGYTAGAALILPYAKSAMFGG